MRLRSAASAIRGNRSLPNRIAFEGWQRLVRRQAEMLQETMKKVVADAGQEDAKKKRADLARVSKRPWLTCGN